LKKIESRLIKGKKRTVINLGMSSPRSVKEWNDGSRDATSDRREQGRDRRGREDSKRISKERCKGPDFTRRS